MAGTAGGPRGRPGDGPANGGGDGCGASQRRRPAARERHRNQAPPRKEHLNWSACRMPRAFWASARPTCGDSGEKGDLKGKKIGSTWRITKAALDEFLKSSRHWAMPEATAQKKFACPACGGEAQWNPAKQALVCTFCGTTSPAQAELTAAGEQVIKEHDLVAALRAIPDSARGGKRRKLPSAARVARPFRCLIRNASASAVISAAPRLSCRMRKSRRRSARKACCR